MFITFLKSCESEAHTKGKGGIWGLNPTEIFKLVSKSLYSNNTTISKIGLKRYKQK
jgi:hypothetical protein